MDRPGRSFRLPYTAADFHAWLAEQAQHRAARTGSTYWSSTTIDRVLGSIGVQLTEDAPAAPWITGHAAPLMSRSTEVNGSWPGQRSPMSRADCH